jgi:hypothetical protein
MSGREKQRPKQCSQRSKSQDGRLGSAGNRKRNTGYLLINRITDPPTVNGRKNRSFSVALHSGTAEYPPLRSILSDSNYRQSNAQDNTQGNAQDNTQNIVLGSAK